MFNPKIKTTLQVGNKKYYSEEANAWVDESYTSGGAIGKIENCKHENPDIGSWGGMITKINDDGSSRPPLVYFRCHKCGYKKLSFEMPPHPNKALDDVLELAYRFYIST